MKQFKSLIAACILGSVGLSNTAMAETPLYSHCKDLDQYSDIADASALFPCSVMVEFWPLASEEERVEILRSVSAVQRLKLRKNLSSISLKSLAALKKLKENGSIVRVVPDRLVRVNPERSNKIEAVGNQKKPTGVWRVNGYKAHASGYKGQGVGIAIVDTGIADDTNDLNLGSVCHDSFLGALNPSRCYDGHGHGTHVAGTAAALDNGVGVIGVAPEATVYAVRVLNNNGSGSDSTVIAGLQWILENAAEYNIQVANLSLGREGDAADNPIYSEAITDLVEAGITVVVAAGNDANLEVSQNVPAAYSNVISVASSTAIKGANLGCSGFSEVVSANAASFFTTDGAEVTVSAPGGKRELITKNCGVAGIGILSLAPGGGTTRMSGTSMAAPHVAGGVALLYSAGVATDGAQAKAILEGSASLQGTAPEDSPTTAYTFDGTREGIMDVCGAGALDC